MENPSLLRLKNANSLKTPRISGCTNRFPTEMDLTRHFRETLLWDLRSDWTQYLGLGMCEIHMIGDAVNPI